MRRGGGGAGGGIINTGRGIINTRNNLIWWGQLLEVERRLVHQGKLVCTVYI